MITIDLPFSRVFSVKLNKILSNIDIKNFGGFALIFYLFPTFDFQTIFLLVSFRLLIDKFQTHFLRFIHSDLSNRILFYPLKRNHQKHIN